MCFLLAGGSTSSNTIPVLATVTRMTLDMANEREEANLWALRGGLLPGAIFRLS